MDTLLFWRGGVTPTRSPCWSRRTECVSVDPSVTLHIRDDLFGKPPSLTVLDSVDEEILAKVTR